MQYQSTFLLLFLLNNCESYHHIVSLTAVDRRLSVSCSVSKFEDPYPLNDYQFLDCGGSKRLEKFGSIIVSRACPSAIWPPGLSRDEWSLAKLIFDVTRTNIDKKSAQRGQWTGLDNLPSNWNVRFETPGIEFNLAASENGQVLQYSNRPSSILSPTSQIVHTLPCHECPRCHPFPA